MRSECVQIALNLSALGGGCSLTCTVTPMARPITDLARRSAIDAVHGVLDKVGPAKSTLREAKAVDTPSKSTPGLMESIQQLHIQTQANPQIVNQPGQHIQQPSNAAGTATSSSRKSAPKRESSPWKRLAAGGFAWKQAIWSLAITVAAALVVLVVFRPDWTFAHEDVLRMAPQIGVSTSRVVASALGCGIVAVVFLVVVAYIRGRDGPSQAA